MEKANAALLPKQEVRSPSGQRVIRIGTPGRIGSSKLTLRKKKVKEKRVSI